MHLTLVAPRPPADHGQTNPDCAAGWHGTVSAHRGGCRCPEAVEAQRIYRKRLREGRHRPAIVDATGTRRRLKALQTIGWRWCDLAPLFGCTSYKAVQKWAISNTVHDDTRQRVRAVYDVLWATLGPSEVLRRQARRKGWAPPQAWDDDDIDDPNAQPAMDGPVDDQPDEVAVARAVTGATTWGALTHTERVDAVTRMRVRGYPPSRIAGLLHIQARHLTLWCRQHLDADSHTKPGIAAAAA